LGFGVTRTSSERVEWHAGTRLVTITTKPGIRRMRPIIQERRGRYELSQLKRLSQSKRLAERRAVVLEWLREDLAPTLDQVSQRLARADPRAAPTEADRILQAKDYVNQLYRSLYDQGLLERRDYPSLERFAREETCPGYGRHPA
jgi:hypothetical protein